MKYERLTNIDKISLLKEEAWLTQEEEEYLRLAELEDKIEAGTLIELPCRVGDKIYVPTFELGDIVVSTIKTYTITSINIFKNEICFMDDTDYDWTAEQFGVIGFLTKSEAEKRLEELRGEN